MKKDCTENSGNSFNNDSNNLVIGIVEVDDIELNNTQFSARHVSILGDNGAQGHVSPSIKCHKHAHIHDVVNVDNTHVSKRQQKDNFTTVDEVVNNSFLVSRRFNKGINVPIVSLTQLMTESMKTKSGESTHHRFVRVLKKGARIYFVEKRSNLCYLKANVTDEVVLNDHATQDLRKLLPVVSDNEDSDEDSDEDENRMFKLAE